MNERMEEERRCSRLFGLVLRRRVVAMNIDIETIVSIEMACISQQGLIDEIVSGINTCIPI